VDVNPVIGMDVANGESKGQVFLDKECRMGKASTSDIHVKGSTNCMRSYAELRSSLDQWSQLPFQSLHRLNSWLRLGEVDRSRPNSPDYEP
jgi:hypothetical protein